MKTVTRAEARSESLKRYFTGIPCKRGHVEERHTSTGKCLACSRMYASKDRKDGRDFQSKNPEYMREYLKDYENKNKLKIKRRYYQKHKASILEKAKLYRENNSGLYVRLCAERRLAIEERTPSWLTEDDKKEIAEIYEKAAEMNRDSPGAYHVDHIIPLRSPLVCGLHVPSNLQILTAEQNTSKGNKLLDVHRYDQATS